MPVPTDFLVFDDELDSGPDASLIGEKLTMEGESMPREVDTTKAQAFAGRLLTALNDASL